jgi:ABC-2 type transport system ATP-binding protein/teichoic acid transport system ATP-binding protein
MSIDPVIIVEHASKTFWVHARTDGTILSRMADFLPSGSKRHHSNCINAVQDVSFEVARGEVLGIVGRNASGKTTLLRLIAGILEPDSGTVKTRGKVTSLIELSVGLRHRLSVRDNICLACSMFGMSRSDIRDAFLNILEFAGVQQYVEMYPYQLSSGMNQRLAFSIAIHTKPEVLLLDEVFSAGDIYFQKKASKKMEELICSDVTVVMVSHSIERLKELSSHIIWMDQGQIQQRGDPTTVIAAYKSALTLPAQV